MTLESTFDEPGPALARPTRPLIITDGDRTPPNSASRPVRNAGRGGCPDLSKGRRKHA